MRIIAALFLLVLAGCSSFVAEPVVRLQNTSLTSIDSSAFELEFLLEVSNPNSYDLSLLGYTYNLKISALDIANGGGQKKVVFRGKQSETVAIPVRVKYSDLFELIKRNRDPDKIPYTIDARLHIDSPVGELLIPIEEKRTFAIPDKYRPSKIVEKLKESLQKFR